MSYKKNARYVEWLDRFVLSKPVLFSLLVILISGVLTELPLDVVFALLVDYPAAEFLRVIAGHTATGLVLVWLLIKLDLLKQARFTSPNQWKALWLLWPFAVFTLLNLDSLISGSLTIDTSRPGLIVLYTLLNLTIGFCEEVMARGVVLVVILQKSGHDRRGVYRAVIVSSLLFGAAHIFNVLSGHLTLMANLTQIVYSFVFGVAFSACFLRNNAIWPVMIAHAAIDFAGGLRHIAVGGAGHVPVPNNTVSQVITTLVISVPLLLYGLFILRKVTPLPHVAVASD